jgi:hypothetical protein
MTPTTIEKTAVAPPIKTPIDVDERGLKIQSIEDLWRFSSFIESSGWAPKGMEKKEQIFIALEMGMELGIPLMSSIQNIAVINGRPQVWGDCVLGIVRNSGHLEAFEECLTNDELDPLFRTIVLTDDRARRKELRIHFAEKQAKMNRKADDFGSTACVRRSGGDEIFGRFTVADAKTAGLWGKTGPWTNYPHRMLTWRARGYLLRDVFPDYLKGLASAEDPTEVDARFAAAKPVFAEEAQEAQPTATSERAEHDQNMKELFSAPLLEKVEAK